MSVEESAVAVSARVPPWRPVLLSLRTLAAGIVEIWAYRELIRNLVVRDLKARYKSSVLGVLWSLLNPLLMMVVFTVVFTLYGNSEIVAFPAFVLCGLLPWNFFVATVVGGMHSIVGNGNLVKKVYFPREVLPISLGLSNTVNYVVSLPVWFVLAWLLHVPLSGGLVSGWVVLLPLVILIQLIFALGIGFILAMLHVYYRDIAMIIDPLMTAWFFLTPIFWDPARLPAMRDVFGVTLPVRWLAYTLNPMASITALYRSILYDGAPPALDFTLRTAATALVALVLGYVIFHRYAGRFGEEV